MAYWESAEHRYGVAIGPKALRAFGHLDHEGRLQVTLDELLCALIVDPSEAEDVADQMGTEQPHSLEDFERHGGVRLRTVALQTIHAYLLTNNDRTFFERAKELRHFDPWLGDWCLLYSAEPMIHVVEGSDECTAFFKYLLGVISSRGSQDSADRVYLRSDEFAGMRGFVDDIIENVPATDRRQFRAQAALLDFLSILGIQVSAIMGRRPEDSRDSVDLLPIGESAWKFFKDGRFVSREVRAPAKLKRLLSVECDPRFAEKFAMGCLIYPAISSFNEGEGSAAR